MKNPHELIFTHPCSRTHSDDYIINKSVANNMVTTFTIISHFESKLESKEQADFKSKALQT